MQERPAPKSGKDLMRDRTKPPASDNTAHHSRDRFTLHDRQTNYLRMILNSGITATPAGESRMRPCPPVDTANHCQPHKPRAANPHLLGHGNPGWRHGDGVQSC